MQHITTIPNGVQCVLFFINNHYSRNSVIKLNTKSTGHFQMEVLILSIKFVLPYPLVLHKTRFEKASTFSINSYLNKDNNVISFTLMVTNHTKCMGLY